MRNLHAHNYESVMYDILWVTIKRDVPELREYLTLSKTLLIFKILFAIVIPNEISAIDSF